MLHDVPVGGGITCQRWSPNGNHLWIGGRRSNDIICYDLRFSRGELGRVTRQLSTNQRLAFDMDPWGTYLATGSQNGELLIYDANHFNVAYSAGSNTGMDCTNSVVFHPHSALLCMSTGQRKYTIELEDPNEVLSPHTGHSNQHDCLLRNSGLRLAMMSHQKLTYLST